MLESLQGRIGHCTRTAIRRHASRTTCHRPGCSVRLASTSAPADLHKTGLYDFHVSRGAKMVPFAGYSMPLSYGDVGAVASHNHVRNSVGLFDVGHMVQTVFRGPSAERFLTRLTPSSLSALGPHSSTLSLLLNERGGIIDDMVITRRQASSDPNTEEWYVVTNAGRRERDLGWMRQQLEEWNQKQDRVDMEVLDGWGLLALQGPEAAQYLQALTSFDFKTLTFGRSAYAELKGLKAPVHIARGGYTGEDGFEISITPEEVTRAAEILSEAPVQLTGLGARDSLRLEAGMCLYGQDLDEDTSPIEAGLTWVIGKDRREATDYIGASGVQEHLKNGPPRRRIGLTVEGAPARQGAKIFSASSSSEEIGKVTSGIPSPTLGRNIAMGYVASGHHKKGTKLQVEVRGKLREAVVTPMPFVPTHYYRG